MTLLSEFGGRGGAVGGADGGAKEFAITTDAGSGGGAAGFKPPGWVGPTTAFDDLLSSPALAADIYQ